MPPMEILERVGCEGWTDLEIVERVRAGDTALYEILMRRYNQRLYRVARAILRDDGEAEDVMQEAYVRAYQHLDQFAGLAPFSTWLTRIAVNEALGRRRLRSRNWQLEEIDCGDEGSMDMAGTSPDPEQGASIAELGHLLEEAILDLPEPYRAVVMLRDIEGMSTGETAAVLQLSEQNVKVRLHRGRARVRNWLFARVGARVQDAFPFMGARCNRVVEEVFARLRFAARESL